MRITDVTGIRTVTLATGRVEGTTGHQVLKVGDTPGDGLLVEER